MSAGRQGRLIIRLVGLSLLVAAQSATLGAAQAQDLRLGAQAALRAMTPRLTATGGGGELAVVRTTPGRCRCEYADSTVAVGVTHPKPNPYSELPPLFCVRATTDISVDMYAADGTLVTTFDFVLVPPGEYSLEPRGFRSLGAIAFDLRVGDRKLDINARFATD